MKHKITIGATPDGKTATFDLDALKVSHLLITGASGSGKSYALRVVAEQLAGVVPLFIIDPEEEYASLREKFDFVLVGEGGDIPIHPRTAAQTAEKLMKLNVSAIFDLYCLEVMQQHLWVKNFVHALMNLPRSQWHSLAVLVTEAHLFCPEHGEGESEATGEMINLASRGRKRGFFNIWDTQRLSKLNKNAASELQNVMVGRTFMHVDRERAAKVLGVPQKSAERERFFNDLKVLQRGQFYGQGVAISADRLFFTVKEAQTRHPEPGSHKAITFPTPASVRSILAELATIPAEVEQKEKTEKELRNEVRTLQAALREAQKPKGGVVDPQAVERAVQAATEKQSKAFQVHIDTVKRLLAKQKEQYGRYAKRLSDIRSEIDSVIADIVILNKVELPAFKSDIFQASQPAHFVKEIITDPKLFLPVRQPRELSISPARIIENGSSKKLRAGAERMLAALVSWHPNGMKEGQMRAMSKMKKSGTYTTYKSDLRQGGYIVENGDLMFASQAGVDYFGGNVPSAPGSTTEVLALWRNKLRDGARRMLDVLVQAGGEFVDKETLAQRANLTESGTFTTYLSDLRTAHLIVSDRERGYAADKEALFL